MNYNIGYLPHPEGTHSTSNAYTPLAIVESGGKSYISKVSVPTGIAVTNTNYCQVFAEGTGVTPQQLQEITAEVETTMLNQGFVQDSGYSTFKSDTQTALENITAPGNGTLTIQKNGTTVSTFTANSSSNVTANISVPTNLSDLGGTSGIVFVPEVYTAARPYTPNDDYSVVHIAKLPQNGIIMCSSSGALNALKVDAYAYETRDAKCLQYATYIYITPSTALAIQAPAGSQFVNGLKRLDANKGYRITVRGYIWEVQMVLG
jgi:hypothetical protein